MFTIKELFCAKFDCSRFGKITEKEEGISLVKLRRNKYSHRESLLDSIIFRINLLHEKYLKNSTETNDEFMAYSDVYFPNKERNPFRTNEFIWKGGIQLKILEKADELEILNHSDRKDEVFNEFVIKYAEQLFKERDEILQLSIEGRGALAHQKNNNRRAELARILGRE